MRAAERNLGRRTWPELGIAAFAAAINYPVCSYTYHGADTSSFIDAGYRVFSGQLPFRDFILPTGPLLHLAQAALFGVFGAGFPGYAALACLFNAAGSVLALRIARRLTGDDLSAAAAGLLTAVWFIPLSTGAATYTSSAMLGFIVSIWLLLRRDPAGNSDLLLCGAAASVTFYLKQSFGGSAALLLALHILQTRTPAAAVRFLAGLASGLAVQTLAWVWMGGWETPLRHLFLIPMNYASEYPLLDARSILLGAVLSAAGARLLGRRELPLWLPTAFLLAIASIQPRRMTLSFFAPLALLPLLKDPRDRALLMLLCDLQFAGVVRTYGDYYQYWGLLGIQFALAWKGVRAWTTQESCRAFLRELLGGWSPSPGLLRVGGLAYLLVAGGRYILRSFWEGILLVPVSGPSLGLAGFLLGGRFLWLARRGSRGMLWAGLAGLGLGLVGAAEAVKTYRIKSRHQALGWIRPEPFVALTRPGLRGLHLKRSEGEPLEASAAYLAGLGDERRPFLVMPGHDILHAALGQPSPQPFIWCFHPINFQRNGPDAEFLCSTLSRSRVRTVLWTAAEGQLSEKPVPACFKEWLLGGFEPDRRIGPFTAYRAKAG